jgi:hypothetical protein
MIIVPKEKNWRKGNKLDDLKGYILESGKKIFSELKVRKSMISQKI